MAVTGSALSSHSGDSQKRAPTTASRTQHIFRTRRRSHYPHSLAVPRGSVQSGFNEVRLSGHCGLVAGPHRTLQIPKGSNL